MNHKKEWEKGILDLTRSEMTRRTFLRSTAAVGLMAGLAPTNLMAGQSSGGPNRGGHVRVAVRGGGTTDSLDPATWVNVFMRTMGYAFCNTLTEIDGSGTLQPEMLESWEATDGAKTWVFKLRSGIIFHNGKTFNAGDVIANINHHSDEKSKSGLKALLKSITKMVREDERTVRFELESGNADFPYIFADYRMMIMPSRDGKLDWKDGIGSGGYRLKSFEPGVRAELERNQNYWRSDRAFFDSAEVITISDATARQSALLTGAADIIDSVDLKTVSLLKKRSGVKVADTVGGLHYTYPMNTTLDPFTSNDLRLALKYGIDREALLHKVLRGYGTLGNDHPIASNMKYFAADLPQRAYDPDKAKFHLKKAGMEGLSLDLSVSDTIYSGAVDGVTLYREQLAKCGIDLKIVREAADGYWSNVWKKKPFIAGYWSPRPTADIMFSSVYLSTAPWNDTYWKNESFDKLLYAARVEMDDAKRGEMYAEMQRLVRDEGGVVIPLFANNVFAMSDKIAHPEAMAGNWELDGGRSIERWWFA